MRPSPLAALPLLALLLTLAAAPPLIADPPPAGDPIRGEALYGRCKACHALDRDRVGPRHCGLLGRPAGSVPGFAYSAALRASGLVWTAETLDRFLWNPRSLVPGTSMTYAGVAQASERADLIAYLAAASADPALCPP